MDTNPKQVKEKEIEEIKDQQIVLEDEKVIRYIQNYQCTKSLGKGSFGVVYKCLLDGQVFAIKVMNDGRKFSKEYFQLEYRALRSIDNQNVVKYIQAFISSEGLYCIVMEHCNMGSLRDYMNQMKFDYFPIEDAVQYFIQILQGFRGIHKAKIIHRDLKLENILIHNNTIKIADFGLAKQMKNEMVRSVCGTYPYMAPEVLAQKQYSYEVDIWSLGVIFFRLVFGSLPFGCHSSQEKQLKNIMACFESDRFQITLSLQKVVQIVSQDVIDIFEKIFVINPKKRITYMQLYEHPIVSQFIEKEPEVFQEQIEVYEQLDQQMLESTQAIGANQQFKVKVEEEQEIKQNYKFQKHGSKTQISIGEGFMFIKTKKLEGNSLNSSEDKQNQTLFFNLPIVDIRQELYYLSPGLKIDIDLYAFAIEKSLLIYEVYTKVKGDPGLGEILGQNQDFYAALKFFLIRLAYFFCKNTDSIISNQLNSFIIQNEEINWRTFVTSKFYPKMKQRSQERLLEIKKEYDHCFEEVECLKFKIKIFQDEIQRDIPENENLQADPKIPENLKCCSRAITFQCYFIIQNYIIEKQVQKSEKIDFQRYCTLFLISVAINHIYSVKKKQFAFNDYVKSYEEFNLIDFFDWINQIDQDLRYNQQTSFSQLNQHIIKHYLDGFQDQTDHDFQIF